MTRIATAVVVGTVAVSLFTPAVYAQDSMQDATLGDAARVQREIYKYQPPAAKKYTNRDVVTTPATPGGAQDVALPSTIVEEDIPPGIAEKSPALPARSIMDRVPEYDGAAPETVQAQPGRTVMDRLPDPPVVVPAGTKITINQYGEVVVPVRVGFLTPIPVDSKVTFVHYGNFSCDDYFGYCGYWIVELASVTVAGTTYPVETGQGIERTDHRWETYTLAKPVTIRQQ